MPLPIRFQRVGFWISTELPDIYMHSRSYVYSILTFEKFDLCRVFRNVITAQLRYKFIKEAEYFV
jgi:hypothetical protein